MAAASNVATESAQRELVISRIFDAPPRVVFKAWTEPEHLVGWWGPQGFTMPSYKMDARPGGAFRFCMRSPEGTDHWLQGVYREIVEPERLVSPRAWEDAEGKPRHETLLTVNLAQHGAETKLTLHPAISRPSRRAMRIRRVGPAAC